MAVEPLFLSEEAVMGIVHANRNSIFYDDDNDDDSMGNASAHKIRKINWLSIRLKLFPVLFDDKVPQFSHDFNDQFDDVSEQRKKPRNTTTLEAKKNKI